jgi:predicted RNase H-like nuclease (RuvC/YqgF family)
MAMIGEQFWTQLIIVFGSVITTYITVKHGPKLTNYLRGTSTEQPSNSRYDTMFNGYERLIKELQSELAHSRGTNERQASIIDNMQTKVNTLQDKLHQAQSENRRLSRKLNAYGENGV